MTARTRSALGAGAITLLALIAAAILATWLASIAAPRVDAAAVNLIEER